MINSTGFAVFTPPYEMVKGSRTIKQRNPDGSIQFVVRSVRLVKVWGELFGIARVHNSKEFGMYHVETGAIVTPRGTDENVTDALCAGLHKLYTVGEHKFTDALERVKAAREELK